jgi:hypothetical protein
MTDYTAIDQALTAAGITMAAVFVPQSKSRHAIKIGPDGKRAGGYCGKGEPCINWTCTVFVDGRELWTGEYSQGSGHLPGMLGRGQNRRTIYEEQYRVEACETGKAIQPGTVRGPALAPPSMRDVLYSLLMDSEAYSQGFEEWADNFGYDRDSRKAEATYNACAAIGRALAARLSPAEIDRLREVFQEY